MIAVEIQRIRVRKGELKASKSAIYTYKHKEKQLYVK